MSPRLDPPSLTADLLYAVETGRDTDRLRERLATLDPDRLDRRLAGREHALAFWLNCYNAYIQLALESDASVLEGGLRERWKFFGRDRIPVAGVRLSLRDVRHGVLRSSKHRWGLGYLPRPFPSSFERRFRLEECEPRIHVALNDGTESHPPVTVYSPPDVDDELDVATEWFLAENVRYDDETETVHVPRLFRRYRGDFGGKAGVLDFLRRYGAVPLDVTPTLSYDRPRRAVDVADARA